MKMNVQAPDRPMVLITSSSGFIGSRLVESLRSDYDLVGFDMRLPQSDIWKVFTVHCDLTSDDSLRGALAEMRKQFGGRLASVVHMADCCDYSGTSSPLYDELNVEGTRRLLRGLQGFEVEQLILISSLLVMEPSEDGQPLTEFSGVRARRNYPASMRAAEWAVANEHEKIPAVVLRIPGVYDEECHLAPLGWQIRRIFERKLDSHLFPGDTDTGRPFLHVEDLVTCIARAIQCRHELEDYELFLIGEPDVMTYAERQQRLGELIHGVPWHTTRIPKTVAKAGAWLKNKLALSASHDPLSKSWLVDLAGRHYPVDIQRARERLGWQPRHRLCDVLPEMVDRLKQAPKQWYETNHLTVPKQLQRKRTSQVE